MTNTFTPSKRYFILGFSIAVFLYQVVKHTPDKSIYNYLEIIDYRHIIVALPLFYIFATFLVLGSKLKISGNKLEFYYYHLKRKEINIENIKEITITKKHRLTNTNFLLNEKIEKFNISSIKFIDVHKLLINLKKLNPDIIFNEEITAFYLNGKLMKKLSKFATIGVYLISTAFFALSALLWFKSPL